MSKNLIKSTVLVLAALGSGSLQAAPINTGGDLSIVFQGFEAGSERVGWINESRLDSSLGGWARVSAGMYSMTLHGGEDNVAPSNVFWGDGKDFNAFCIQTWQALTTSGGPIGGYSLWSLGEYLNSPPHGNALPTDAFSRISTLFSLTDVGEEHEGTIVLGDNVGTDAAFQLALWGIINGDDFEFSGFGDAGQHVDGWMSAIGDAGNQPTSRLDFYVLSSETSQDLLVWKTAAATEVPLPATLWLMLAGILGVGLARRS